MAENPAAALFDTRAAVPPAVPAEAVPSQNPAASLFDTAPEVPASAVPAPVSVNPASALFDAGAVKPAAQASFTENVGAGWQRGADDVYTMAHATEPVIRYQVLGDNAKSVAETGAALRAHQKERGSGVAPAEPWTLPWVEQAVGNILPSTGVVAGGALMGAAAGGAAAMALGPEAVPAALVSAPAGALMGLAGSSALLTNATAFYDYLDAHGVDTSNAAATEAALAANPSLGNDASWYAIARSGISAGVNAVAGKLGGWATDRFFSAGAEAGGALAPGLPRQVAELGNVKPTLGAKVAGYGAEAGIATGAAAAQSAANQLQDSGSVDLNKLAQDTVLGAAGLFPTVLYAGGKIAAKPFRGKASPGESLPNVEPHLVKDAAGNGVLNPALYPVNGDPEAGAAIKIARAVLTSLPLIPSGDPNVKFQTHESIVASGSVWRETLLRALPPETWSDTQTGDNMYKLLDGLSDKNKYDVESILEMLLKSRTVLKAVHNPANVNLEPDLIVNSPAHAAAGPLEVKISTGHTKGAVPALMIESSNRAIFESEAIAISKYANDKGYNVLVWDKGNPFHSHFVRPTGSRQTEYLASFDAMQKPAKGARWVTQTKTHAAEEIGAHWEARSMPTEISGASTVPDEARNAASATAHEIPLSDRHTPEALSTMSVQLNTVLQKMAKSLNLSHKLTFEMNDKPSGMGHAWGMPNEFIIRLNPKKLSSWRRAYETMAHELGHVITYDRLRKADPSVVLAILDEYQRWRDDVASLAAHSRAAAPIFITKEGMQKWLADRNRITNNTTVAYADPSYQAYWHSFAEWFAEQTGRWMVGTLKPLSVVDAEFNKLGSLLFRSLSRVYRMTGMQFEPKALVKEYLDSLLSVNPSIFASVAQKIAIQSMLANQASMKAMGAGEVDAIPTTSSTQPMRLMKLKIFSGENTGRWKRKPGPAETFIPSAANPLPPAPDKVGYTKKFGGGLVKNFDGLMSVADIINRFVDKTFGIHEIAAANPHIRELVLYKDILQQAENEKHRIINNAVATLKKIKRIPSISQRDELIKAMDNYDAMRYRTQLEADQGVERLPTPAEMDKLLEKLTPQTRDIFHTIVKDYDDFLSLVADVSRGEAMKGGTLPQVAARLQEIDATLARQRASPYVPHLRFGEFTVIVEDTDGNRVHFATTDSRRERVRLANELRKHFPEKLYTVKESILPKQALPFLGLPPNMLKLIEAKLDLSKAQIDAIHDMQYQMNPATSFRHKLTVRDTLPGYSKDMLRAYSDFFLHGANFLARAKYADGLKAQIRTVKEQSDFLPKGQKRMQIHNAMANHLGDWLDPKPDYWRFKSVAFFIHLGYNAKSALVNLTQLPTQTLPFLERGFGKDAGPAMLKAMTELQTYYSRASLEGRPELFLRMLDALTKEGTLTEALGPELAAAAEDRNMVNKYLGNAAQRTYATFMHGAGWMFQMTEAMNRRITAGAAYHLAKANPTALLVREALAANPEQFARLVNSGHSYIEARAITTAKHAVEATQGIYARWARPKMFRGRLGTLFMFKSFQKQMLFMLYNYPATIVKSTLMMGFLGGLMGIPGVQDVNDLIKAVAYQFDKHFDVEQEARQLIIDLTNGNVPPDLIVHGTSRWGFGLPALADLVGNTVNLGDMPFPVTDISSSVGFGPINPVPLAPLFGPVTDPNTALGDAAQHASGAAYSLAFSMYKVLTDPLNGAKWAGIAPRALYNLKRAYDAYNDDVVSADGTHIVRFDPRDTRQMAEIIAQGLGFTPLRTSAGWDRIRAIKEAEIYWNARRSGLIRQFTAAAIAQSPEDKESALKAIRQFNQMLPGDLKGQAIRGESLRSSIDARFKAIAVKERGQAPVKKDTGLVRGINRLYPEADIVATKPRGSAVARPEGF